MLKLKRNPTMKDYQLYVGELVEERGFSDETVPEIFILFVEEIGEMIRSILKGTNERAAISEEIPHEISDSFTYLLDIANHSSIDVEQAFRQQFEHQTLEMKEKPTLLDYQKCLSRLTEVPGYVYQSMMELVCLFLRQVGNLASAIRKEYGIKVDLSIAQKELSSEIAKSLAYILFLANHFSIDAEQAFRRKEEINKQRTWERANPKRCD